MDHPRTKKLMEVLSGLCDWQDSEAVRKAIDKTLREVDKEAHSQGWGDAFDEIQPF